MTANAGSVFGGLFLGIVGTLLLLGLWWLLTIVFALALDDPRFETVFGVMVVAHSVGALSWLVAVWALAIRIMRPVPGRSWTLLVVTGVVGGLGVFGSFVTGVVAAG